MFFNILKKDLKRKKSMNAILFVFIVLCTTFMASSISNLTTVLHAVDYFGEQTEVTDYFILASEEEPLDAWRRENPYIKDGQKETYYNVQSEYVRIPSGRYGTSMTGSTIIGKLPLQYNRVLDEDGKPMERIENGEMAIPYILAKNNHIKKGDTITIAFEGKEKSFTVNRFMKDMVFGSDYIDIKRLLVSEEDYEFFEQAKETPPIHLYSLITDDAKALEKDVNRQNLSVLFSFDKAMLRSTFLMDMMVASILILVSICLIVIAFVILRFTIVFTLQDDYKEIGVMKAIGLKNMQIKGIYVTKYLALALVGTVVGAILSIPFGTLMLKDVGHTMVLKPTGNIAIPILCGVVILLFVLGFCYLSAGKLNKFTAIQAIRSGVTGERFKSKSRYYLHRRKKVPTIFYMAVNNIFSAVKSYGVLVITFVIGTLLVILPLNAVNTLNSDGIIEYFGIAESDAYIEEPSLEMIGMEEFISHMKTSMEELKGIYKDYGIDAVFHFEYAFFSGVYANDAEDVHTILSFQAYNYEASEYRSYIDGTPPVLPNEIAMTEIAMKKLGVVIGDVVHITLGEEVREFIVTASYQTMNNMGHAIRFSPNADLTNMDNDLAGIFGVQMKFLNRRDVKGQLEKVREITPKQYKVKTPKDMTSAYVGRVIDSINSLKSLILIVVLLINCLITVLLMRTFIVKEASEIALLKSIGFTERSIRIWQTLRILLVLLTSILLGMTLSNPLNAVTAKYTFGMMGAPKISLNVIAKEAYFLYPLILFIGTGLAAVFSTGKIRRIHIREIGNLE